MGDTVRTIIDTARCNGCGLCVAVCPCRTIAMVEGRAVVSGDRSLGCGHCEAVCPTGAVRVESLAGAPRLLTVQEDDRWLRYGDFDTAALARLMRSRRSCRNYTSAAVEQRLLADLITMGITAPSGTNSQKWSFTVLAAREQVVRLGNGVAAYFERLNRLAARPAARMYSRLFGGDELGRYYRRYYRTVEDNLAAWRREGVDRLFHGATAAIVVGSLPGAGCPCEDALLASQNMLLAAYAMGLGTCLIGFAVEAMNRDPELKRLVDIPAAEPVYAVIALGWPAEHYRRPAKRRRPVVRLVGGPAGGE